MKLVAYLKNKLGEHIVAFVYGYSTLLTFIHESLENHIPNGCPILCFPLSALRYTHEPRTPLPRNETCV